MCAYPAGINIHYSRVQLRPRFLSLPSHSQSPLFHESLLIETINVLAVPFFRLGFAQIADNAIVIHPHSERAKAEKQETRLRFRKGDTRRNPRSESRSRSNPAGATRVVLDYRYKLSQSHPARCAARRIRANCRHPGCIVTHSVVNPRSRRRLCPRSVSTIIASVLGNSRPCEFSKCLTSFSCFRATSRGTERRVAESCARKTWRILTSGSRSRKNARRLSRKYVCLP